MNDAIKAFADQHPYTTFTEPDADGNTLFKVRLTQPLPDELTDFTHEIAETARSALDQAGYTAACLAGKVAPKSAYFPIADDAPGLEAVIKGRCKDLPPDVVAFFRKFKAHKGGNDLLWAMNKIANTKHTALIPVGTGNVGYTVKYGELTGTGAILAPVWDGEKEELTFGRTGPGGKFEFDIEFQFFIAFGKVPGLEGHPVPGTFVEIISICDGIVAGTEAECVRLGLLRL